MFHPRLSVACAVRIFAALALAPTVAAASLALETPAPGVYVHYGRHDVTTIDNRGDIANLGFIVGSRCVAVIDTGGSAAVGAALRAAIRRVTDKPVCYVINTHVHPDHVFGNAAFVDDRPQFVGHARMPEALARRGPHYLNALRRDLGTAADGTELVAPTLTVVGETRLDLGDRALTLRAWPTAHTDHDLTVFDEASATLFLGDLVFEGHLPVVDGNLRGMLAAIEELKRMPARLAIPGHGRAVRWPEVMDAQQRYLQRLLIEVKQAIAAKRTLAQAVETVGGDERDRWRLFDVFHRRNVAAAYAELEWDE